MSKKTIKISDLHKIIKDIPRIEYELDNNSYGDVSQHYKELIDPSDVIYYVNKFLENK